MEPIPVPVNPKICRSDNKNPRKQNNYDTLFIPLFYYANKP